MLFRILHISDVHFGPHCWFQHADPVITGEIAADALLDHLEEHGLRSGCRAVVVSGDFTWKNIPAEFELGVRFVSRLSTGLGLPLSNFVIVPGNHDVTWSETDPGLAKQFHYLLREQAERGYRDFFAAVNGEEAADYLTVTKLFEAERVVIVGLNSCRLHEKRNAGLGYVGRDQFEEVVRELRQNEIYKRNENQFFKIAVLHHHLLPAVDLDLRELDKPPSEREFSLTIDADSVLDLLLADNFALVLHGHLHVPFCGVERRLPVTVDNPPANSEAHIAVAGVGSLCVDKQYAERNHYQLIDLDEDRVVISSFETEYLGGIICDLRDSRVSLERRVLTRPSTRLSLKPYDDHMLDLHSRKMEESAILAERVFQNDRFAIDFLFQPVPLEFPQQSAKGPQHRAHPLEAFPQLHNPRHFRGGPSSLPYHVEVGLLPCESQPN